MSEALTEIGMDRGLPTEPKWRSRPLGASVSQRGGNRFCQRLGQAPRAAARPQNVACNPAFFLPD